MIAALPTGQKIGLAVVAAVFVVFALVSAFVLPRRDPDYPGKRLGVFIGISALLFVAMLTAVLVFGAEPKESKAASEGTTTSKAGGGTSTAPAAAGDATKGKAVFAAKGCGNCHSISGPSTAVAPTLKGLAGSTVTLADGSTVTADDAYILESIEDPAAKVVKGPWGTTSPMAGVITKGSVSSSDAADLVAYIKTLK